MEMHLNSGLQRRRPQSRPHEQGFSLIELMVGLVLGMIAVIVVMQVFSLSSRGQRTATSGDDAQMIGALAVAQLQRDLRQSGQGATSGRLLGCNIQLPGGLLTAMGRIVINHPNIPAGDANTDTLVVLHGSSYGSPDGDRVRAVTGGNNYAVDTFSSFQLNDFVVAAWRVQPVNCNLLMDRVVGPGPALNSLFVATGAVAPAPEVVYNFGATPRVVAYAVRGGRLTECNFMLVDCRNNTPANWQEIGDGVISLRAQYLFAGGVSNQITPAPNCLAWQQLAGVRFAVTTRSGQLEREQVTTAANAPAWSGSANLAIDPSGMANWQNYRYKVFEAVVPLRNNAQC